MMFPATAAQKTRVFRLRRYTSGNSGWVQSILTASTIDFFDFTLVDCLCMYQILNLKMKRLEEDRETDLEAESWRTATAWSGVVQRWFHSRSARFGGGSEIEDDGGVVGGRETIERERRQWSSWAVGGWDKIVWLWFNLVIEMWGWD